MRSIVFDTETTGLNRGGSPELGHRIIEIGGVELLDGRLTGRQFHQYINPEMPIDPEATRVHGIDDARLRMEPTFAQIFAEFWAFFGEADQWIAHNLSFDLAFIRQELRLLGRDEPLEPRIQMTDTLKMARQRGYRPASLDALCKRFQIDLSQRQVHGALLDAKLLTEVYLKMTQSQQDLQWSLPERPPPARLIQDGWLPVQLTDEERAAHRALLAALNKGE